MKVENGKIVEITESELFTLYLKRGMDDIYSFPQYVEMFKKAGCVILDQEAQQWMLGKSWWRYW